MKKNWIYIIKLLINNCFPAQITSAISKNIFFSHFRHRYNYWITIRRRLKQQLSDRAKDVRKYSKYQGKKVLIPLIETNHYQYAQILITAKALQLRGAQVKVLLCGQVLDGCEIKSVRTEDDKDPCWTCRYNERNIVPLFGLDTIHLADVLTKDEQRELDTEIATINNAVKKSIVKEGIDLTQCIEDSVVRYFYGGVPFDQQAHDKVRLAHTKTAIMSLQIAKSIDQSWTPDVVFNNMGCYSAWEAYSRYYDRHGNRFCTLSITPFDYGRVRFNLPNLFKSSHRFHSYKNTRRQDALSEVERIELSQFLENRLSGRAKIFKDLGVYLDNSLESEQLRIKLEINSEKRNIFLFPNIHWDVGLSDNGGLYGNVIDWVLDTIELSSKFHDCHIYIKPHPAEVYGTSSIKGISQFIGEKYPLLPGNITIIEPHWQIKPYDLFPFIDVGVIFTGTLGLEMMLNGIPVISTGLTSHKGLKLASEPESIIEYSEMLSGAINLPPVDQAQLELFAYFYFIRTLIPWNLTKQAYGDHFDGFTFKSLSDIESGKDSHLDHLCKCILDPGNSVPEEWPAIACSQTSVK